MPKRIKKTDTDDVPTPPMGVELALPTEPIRLESVLSGCPTCGTSKGANRCEVCGHQEHDT